MRDLLNEMKLALKFKAYYPALITAVTIPDICAFLHTGAKSRNKARYIKWFNDYASKRFKGLVDGTIAYDLRNSVLHEGSLEAESGKSFDHFLVVLDNKGLSINQWGVKKGGNEYLAIELNIFCDHIHKSVIEWLNKLEKTKMYQKNYKLFFKKDKLETPWGDEMDVIAVFQ
jgi:hypothetical protein